MKMILADDEPVITRGIQKLIDFRALGIEVVGVYEDGKSAFDALMSLQPELAILDIAMPRMNGIDIIREAAKLGCRTKVIFISGFQDFTYAKSAVKYGACDYLLKPVIREELLTAIESAMKQLGGESSPADAPHHEEALPDYSALISEEETTYLPVYAGLLFTESAGEQTKKLARFSFRTNISQWMDAEQLGICFAKDGNTAIVFRGKSRTDVYRHLAGIREKIRHMTGLNSYYVMGREIAKMSEIPDAYAECLDHKDYQFFGSSLPDGILDLYAEGTESIRSAIAYIEAHFREEMTLSDVADAVHMNPYYFSSFFKKQTGENYKDYIAKIRAKHAMILLNNSDLKNYEIAAAAGFSDTRSMNNAFVKCYGMLPNEYRKKQDTEDADSGV